MLLTPTVVKVAAGGTSYDTVPCGFDPEGTAHLMRVLSNLYQDAAAAVLREYSANAYDSHVQAANPGPIEVTLPSDLNPTLVVTDHGTGLTRDEMIGVYSRYGASTKRGTNDQVGAFGLGTKSAFTLGQQFVVTAVKDGWRTVAAFGLNTSGTGTVTILGHEPAGERNGVTVSISVDDPGAMQRAAGPVFSTWRPGTVLVNGARPRSVLDDPLRVTEGIYLADTAEQDSAAWGDAGLIVVMGNIGYPVSHSLRDKLRDRLRHRNARILTPLLATRRNQRTFAFVGIGDADIAPSREEMRDTSRTLTRLVRVVDEYCDGVAALVQREIDSAPTLTAAARTVASLSRRPHLADALDRSNGLAWRGQRIASQVTVPYPTSAYSTERQRCVHERDGFRLALLDAALSETLVVTDVPASGQEAAIRAARAFLADDGPYRRLVFAVPGAQPAQWFAFGQPDTLPALSFTEYLAEARQRTPAATGRAAEPIRYATIAGPAAQQLTAGEIAGLGLPVVVTGSHEELSTGAMRYPAFAQKVRDGVAIVELAGGRTQAALQRRLGEDVPATTLKERASTVAAAVAASFTEQDRETERLHACAARTPANLIRALAELRGQITNPAVTAVLDRPVPSAGTTVLTEVLAGAREQEPALFPAGGHAGLVEQFPLLASVPYHTRLGARTRRHVVAYLNALAGSGSPH